MIVSIPGFERDYKPVSEIDRKIHMHKAKNIKELQMFCKGDVDQDPSKEQASQNVLIV